ncbi:MAG: 30S ribosome-binding factor RbfA [Bacilli bacterium]|nr:30S ribosome-binding factor RbfA [Bacilli bacterium]
MAFKIDRDQVAIQKYVSDIIQFEVHSKEIGFVTITGCKLTSDYSYAKIYCSFLGKGDYNKNLEALNKVKGFIRTSLSKKLTIRKTPELIFVLDDSYERANRIEQIIKDIHKD